MRLSKIEDPHHVTINCRVQAAAFNRQAISSSIYHTTNTLKHHNQNSHNFRHLGLIFIYITVGLHTPRDCFTTFTMSERDLQSILQELRNASSYADALPLLSQAKLTLLKHKALTPSPSTPPSTLSLAREVFEVGALLSIRAKDPAAFTRYKHLLTPFYELSSAQTTNSRSRGGQDGEKNKITGLYLLLLLTQGDYSGFHTELEGLEVRGEQVEGDRYLAYPIKLERWLMEGSYDLVWRAMAAGEVPSEEYAVFSEVY